MGRVELPRFPTCPLNKRVCHSATSANFCAVVALIKLVSQHDILYMIKFLLSTNLTKILFKYQNHFFFNKMLLKGEKMNVKIVEAQRYDREFILFANREIDDASFIKSSKLKDNIDKDIFENHNAICLIAKDGDKPVGMVLFSKVYWADRGEGVYLSQAYVEPAYRHNGVFKLLIEAVMNYYQNTQFLTCLVAKKNLDMVSCMKKLKFEDEDMISYAKNKSDFHDLA